MSLRREEKFGVSSSYEACGEGRGSMLHLPNCWSVEEAGGLFLKNQR